MSVNEDLAQFRRGRPGSLSRRRANWRTGSAVLLPSQHIIGAISSLLLPLFAGSRAKAHFRSLVISLLVCFAGATLAAWLATGLFGARLIAASVPRAIR